MHRNSICLVNSFIVVGAHIPGAQFLHFQTFFHLTNNYSRVINSLIPNEKVTYKYMMSNFNSGKIVLSLIH